MTNPGEYFEKLKRKFPNPIALVRSMGWDLAHYFEAIFGGLERIDAYEAVRSALGMRPEQIAVFGDNPAVDLLEAFDLGYRCCGVGGLAQGDPRFPAIQRIDDLESVLGCPSTCGQPEPTGLSNLEDIPIPNHDGGGRGADPGLVDPDTSLVYQAPQGRLGFARQTH